VDDHAVTVTHADRIVFPDIGLTKGEVVEYYRRIARYLLPHLRDRPLTMQIFPKGVGERGTYVKERRGHFPEWVGSATVATSDATRKKRGGADLIMPVIDSADALVYVANQGMITPHVWLTRVDRPNHPDRLVFDLDPSTDDFSLVRTTALQLRDVLEGRGLVPFVKTTGSRGLHVTVPLDRSATIEEARAFAEDVAAELVVSHPDRLTTEFSKAARGDRLFLDVMRNGHAQTEIAAYGLRGRAGAPIAAPLEWDEVRDGSLSADRWNVRNIFRRLARRDDPWVTLDRSARPLPRVRPTTLGVGADHGKKHG
jgi:bifunctional non-homologous end joining protein LigD